MGKKTIKQIIKDLELAEKQWRGGKSQYSKGKYDGLWFALAHIKQLEIVGKCYFCGKKSDDLVSWEHPDDHEKDIDYLFLVCPVCEEKLRELIDKTKERR